MVRHNKSNHISKQAKKINQIKNNKNTNYKKPKIKEKSWGETHLTYGSQLCRDLTGLSVSTQQDSMRFQGK